MKTILAFLFCIALSGQTLTLSDSDIKAFPTAEGAGYLTTGGRGGTVYRVTNLNSSGAGSFYAALTATGSRVIVFDVSGEIDLGDQRITLSGSSYNNLTILGQTAPQGGITLTNGEIFFSSVDNIIIRYIRIRPNRLKTVGADTYPEEYDAIWFQACEDVIVDHVSASFGGDETISATSTTTLVSDDITIQRCLFGQTKTGNIIGNGSPGTADGFAQDHSLIKNLYHNGSHRHPLIGGDGRIDIINNVISAWSFFPIMSQSGTHNLNFMYNYMKERSTTPDYELNRVTTSSPTIYSAFNVHTGVAYTLDNDQQELWTGAVSGDFTTTQHTVLGDVDILSAADAYTELVINEDVGANRYLSDIGTQGIYLDTYDQDMIDRTVANTTLWTWNGNASTFIPANWVNPTIPENTRGGSFDTDSDGLPDWFETLNGGGISPSTRPATAETPDGTIDQSGVTSYASAGYTYLDIYAGYAADDWAGYTPDPVYTPEGRIKSYQIKGGKMTVGGKVVN